MVVRSAPVAQCITDDNYRILSVDDSYVEVLGRPRAEIIGRSPLEFTAPVDQAVNDLLLQQLDREGRAFTITKRYIRGDGGLQWVSNHVSSFSDGAGPRRILATCEPRSEPQIVSDVTRIRQNAQALARTIDAAKRAFGEDLIGSPALEALLHLHLAELEGRSLTPRCIAALIRHPEATTLRWIRVLEQRRLAEVECDAMLDLAAPMRISGPAQRMMEDLVDPLPPYHD